MKRISNINTIIRENTKCLQNQDFKQKKICSDPNIKKITKTDENSPTYFPVTNLDIIDTAKGIKCENEQGVLQFLLLPRHVSLKGNCKIRWTKICTFPKISRDRPILWYMFSLIKPLFSNRFSLLYTVHDLNYVQVR